MIQQENNTAPKEKVVNGQETKIDHAPDELPVSPESLKKGDTAENDEDASIAAEDEESRLVNGQAPAPDAENI